MHVTYIGGPTALIEWNGARLLTDPTFDPAGSEYPTPVYTLRKTMAPAIPADRLGPIDGVLLSHDHHFDNLDRAGRMVAEGARRILTTHAGAERLGGAAIGLASGEEIEIPIENRPLRVHGISAQHGPAGRDRGPVTGFVLWFADEPSQTIYFSGDTVWHSDIEGLGGRFNIRLALLNLGAARVAKVGPEALTFTADEAIAMTRSLPAAAIVPLHFEGWEHFSESRADIAAAFGRPGLAHRLRWLTPGVRTGIPEMV